MLPLRAEKTVSSALSDPEFKLFRDLIHKLAGISLSDAKKPLVAGRLSKRLRQLGMVSYSDYFQRIQGDGNELQHAVDLLTTNETYFFREPRHFDFLCQQILPTCIGRGPLRVWSGACSSGEEPYTIAMLLAEHLGQRPWEIVASDLSHRVLNQAATGLYRMEDAEGIPASLLRKHCLRGVGRQEGAFMVNPALTRLATHRASARVAARGRMLPFQPSTTGIPVGGLGSFTASTKAWASRRDTSASAWTLTSVTPRLDCSRSRSHSLA